MKEYDAILFGGIPNDHAGRTIGMYRLRSACERNGYSVKVIDYAWGLKTHHLMNLLDKFVSKKTKVIGFSTLWIVTDESHSYTNDEFFSTIKNKFPNCKIVAGGANDSIRNNVWKNYADFYITGFADISFVRLLDKLNQKNSLLRYWKLNNGPYIIDSDLHYVVKNTDELETIFYPEDNFKSFQPIPLEISRGCIFKCAFCSFPFLGKKDFDYIRTSENLANELKRNYDLFGTTRYVVTDDTFNDSIEKLDRVKKAIEISKIPKFEFVSFIKGEMLVSKPSMITELINLGFKGGHLGIESLSNVARKSIGKGLDINKVLDASRKLTQLGAQNHASFIIGLPSEDIKSIFKTQEYLFKQNFNLFSSWKYYGLGIHKNTKGDSYSEFGKYPEKFGFKIRENKNILPWLDWENDQGVDVHTADMLAKKLNIHYSSYKVAGWDIANAWHNNRSDEEIKKLKISEIKELNSINDLTKIRVAEMYQNDINE